MISCWRPIATAALLTWLACCAVSVADDAAAADAAAADPAQARAAAPLAAARKLLLGGKYAEAAEAYKSLSGEQPVAAALGLARAEKAVGELDAALASLQAAAKSHPDAAELPAEQAAIYFERGDYPAASDAVAAALRLDADQLHARWLQAELARVSGKLDDANQHYKSLVDYYNDHELKDADGLRFVGLAAAQYARWNRLSKQFGFLVNELYPDALELEPGYWPAHFETAMLFLEKYNEADATKELKAALAQNPNSADLQAAVGLLAVQGYELDDAQAAVDRALEINPRCQAAMWVQADIHLSNLELDKAVATLEKARALNPHCDEVLGRLAAVYWALDGVPKPGDESRAGKLIAEVVARNPHAGEFFVVLGDALDRLRRFPSAAVNYQRAVELMPQLADTRGKWGLVLMRLGDEAAGKKLLEEAFDTDPFNVRVSNTLKVLEVLDEYEDLKTAHFIIRHDAQRDKIMARYAARWLEEVYPQLCKQFGFEPPQASLFEIFNRAKNTDGHGWFSARMVGLPHVHTIGACAGKMVAMQSPNQKGQQFNWARVLKHEFIHVLNLQQTDFNIPHWYTEALAVLNEGYPRPQAWNDLLVERVPAGKIFNLDNINLGFIRAHSSDEWSLAYCQAELYAEYMLATYGDDALARLLAAYAANLGTREALQRAFGVEQEEFEKGYLRHLEKLVAGLTATKKTKTLALPELQKALAAKPKDPDLLAQMALAQLNRKNYPAARKLVDAALAGEPKQQLASYVRARLHMVVGEDAEAHKLLVAALDEEQPKDNLLGLLAGLELASEHYAEAARLYELGAKRDPHDTKWLKSLARVYLKSNDKPKLAVVLEQLATIDADDAPIRKKLAELARDAKDHPATIRWAGEVIQIDVMDPEVHHWLGDALAASKQPAPAAEEYEVAVELAPEEPGLRYYLAQAYLASQQPQKAAAALKELLKLEPQYPGAEQLLETIKP